MTDKYKKFLEMEFTVFDVETSGLNPEKDDVLEIAALKLRGQEIIGRLELLAQPTRSIPLEAERVHGLNEIYLLVNGQSIDSVIKKFLEFLGNSIVVGHNIREFDWLFILYYTKKFKWPQPENKIIDTLELSRKLLSLPSNTLANVANYFGFEHKDAHRAMPDVEMNAKVFLKLMELLLNQKDWFFWFIFINIFVFYFHESGNIFFIKIIISLPLFLFCHPDRGGACLPAGRGSLVFIILLLLYPFFSKKRKG